MLKNIVSKVRVWNRLRRAKLRAAIAENQSKLAVLAIMKNESSNIDEWIEHYLWMGASTIYLIDNGSTDDTVEKARAWERTGQVNVIIYPEKHQQRKHYWKAINHFDIRKKYEWLLIADLDEFWFCPNGDSLATALLEFDPFYVIYSNWVMFGSSGYIEQPEGIRESFLYRKPGIQNHLFTKYICQTCAIKNASTIDIHKVCRVDSARTISDITRFQVNHYPIQSLNFFRSVKMTRGDVSGEESEHIRDMSYFHQYDEGCTEVDRRLADLLTLLETRS